MDEINEGCWLICWSKGHNCVSPLNCVHSLKSKFFLTRFFYSQLMIPHRCIKHPQPQPIAKLVKDRRITSWDGVRNQKSDTVQGDVIDAEAPDEVLNIVDRFLVWFCSE